MTANEVRFGNLVYYHKHDDYSIIDPVVDTIKGVEPQFFDLEESGRIIPCASCTGIPLTEEWLLKFGFIKTLEYEDGNCDWMLLQDGEKIGFLISGQPKLKDDIEGITGFVLDEYFYTKAEIKYIHQLQNLFHALTGQELTIKEA